MQVMNGDGRYKSSLDCARQVWLPCSSPPPPPRLLIGVERRPTFSWRWSFFFLLLLLHRHRHLLFFFFLSFFYFFLCFFFVLFEVCKRQKSSLDCINVWQLIRAHGVSSLYKGLIACYLKVSRGCPSDFCIFFFLFFFLPFFSLLFILLFFFFFLVTFFSSFFFFSSYS